MTHFLQQGHTNSSKATPPGSATPYEPLGSLFIHTITTSNLSAERPGQDDPWGLLIDSLVPGSVRNLSQRIGEDIWCPLLPFVYTYTGTQTHIPSILPSMNSCGAVPRPIYPSDLLLAPPLFCSMLQSNCLQDAAPHVLVHPVASLAPLKIEAKAFFLSLFPSTAPPHLLCICSCFYEML